MSSALDQERSRTTAISLEKKEWADLRINLENKLTEAQNLNDSIKQELQRVREDHETDIQRLREEVTTAQRTSRNVDSSELDTELQRENDDLRHSLREQQQVTEEVRREAAEFLHEMRALSQQSGSTYERQAELEKTVERLEREVHDWRNRFARTKTQLRHMRASSTGIGLEHEVTQVLQDKGFVSDHGLVKDVHVTKFQIAIDELLQRARSEDPDHVIDGMKSVVVSVRRITKDLSAAQGQDEETVQQQVKLKAKISLTANNLITASKNYAAGAGIMPVSLVDTAASHLTAAIVDLLQAVKIRTTPAEELENEDDGTVTPVDSTGLFSPVVTDQASTMGGMLSQPPPSKGPIDIRGSVDSSAYSPLNSPRLSADPYSHERSMSKSSAVPNGLAYSNPGPVANASQAQQRDDRDAQDLKMYLQDQNALLVADIQKLVETVRGDADIRQITAEIESISATVTKIISETQSYGYGEMATRLAHGRARLLEAGDQGQDMANIGMDTNSHEWRMWSQTLPPIAFEMAREHKELVQHVDRLITGRDEDFS